MPEYSGLKIYPFGDILVCLRMKTHGYCERHSPRPEKQIITLRVALCRRSIILFYLYILCIIKQYNYIMYQTCIITSINLKKAFMAININTNSLKILILALYLTILLTYIIFILDKVNIHFCIHFQFFSYTLLPLL